MKKKWLLLGALAMVLLALSLAYVHFSGRLSFLTLNTQATIELNGAPVQGEMLDGRTTAVVTIREAGMRHSYQLFFEGDTDFTGDMGFVVDCGPWVAPHLPLLPETRNYPPCQKLLQKASQVARWPLIDKGKSMLFVLQDQSTIRVSR
jgi:hypothetical protein